MMRFVARSSTPSRLFGREKIAFPNSSFIIQHSSLSFRLYPSTKLNVS